MDFVTFCKTAAAVIAVSSTAAVWYVTGSVVPAALMTVWYVIWFALWAHEDRRQGATDT